MTTRTRVSRRRAFALDTAAGALPLVQIRNKNQMTIAAEAQARTGNDIEAFPPWEVRSRAACAERGR
jgi:hypothetical protein